MRKISFSVPVLTATVISDSRCLEYDILFEKPFALLFVFSYG